MMPHDLGRFGTIILFLTLQSLSCEFEIDGDVRPLEICIRLISFFFQCIIFIYLMTSISKLLKLIADQLILLNLLFDMNTSVKSSIQKLPDSEREKRLLNIMILYHDVSLPLVLSAKPNHIINKREKPYRLQKENQRHHYRLPNKYTNIINLPKGYTTPLRHRISASSTQLQQT